MIVVLVNLVLIKVIVVLIEKEKHFTVSAYQSALAMKIFLSQFMNTALTILVINCNLQSLGIGLPNVFSAEFGIDFSYDWCDQIGNSIMMTAVMGCLNPHLVYV